MGSDDNAETFMHLAAELYKLNIAYLHVTDGIGDSNNAASKKASWYVPTHAAITPPSLSPCHSLTASLPCVLLCRFGRVASDGFHGKAAHLTLSEIKSAFPGPLIGNGGYDGTT